MLHSQPEPTHLRERGFHVRNVCLLKCQQASSYVTEICIKKTTDLWRRHNTKLAFSTAGTNDVPVINDSLPRWQKTPRLRSGQTHRPPHRSPSLSPPLACHSVKYGHSPSRSCIAHVRSSEQRFTRYAKCI